MERSGRSDEALRVDVTGDVAAIELVERLRWARPRVTPLDGDGWRISIARGVDCSRALGEVRAWLRAQELAATTVVVDGRPQLVEPAA
jgi:hypothetical protein